MARIGTTVEVFQYPPGPEPRFPCWDGLTHSGATGENESTHLFASCEDSTQSNPEGKTAEKVRQGFEDGRARGLQEGRQAERDAQAAVRENAERDRARQITEALQSFAQERDRYLQAVEHEVVKLALAVAARILRREAQMDPLLLAGAVRVALGQLAHSTVVRLRIPGAEQALWTEAMALVPNLAPKPLVVTGPEMRLGDCVIETELGSVDLGIRAQLGEIERGFFDRVAVGMVEKSAYAGGLVKSEAEAEK